MHEECQAAKSVADIVAKATREVGAERFLFLCFLGNGEDKETERAEIVGIGDECALFERLRRLLVVVQRLRT